MTDETPVAGDFKKALKELGECVASVRHASMSRHGIFRCVRRAAIVKAFEFAKAMQDAQPQPFFLTSTLRGICEDLIVLSFVAPLDERDRLIRALTDRNMAEGMTRQNEFFDATRPWQPVVKGDGDGVADAVERVKEIAKLHGWSRDRVPSIRDMATKTGDLPLYDYLYAATSKWVHFSPHLLLRMGWTDYARREELNETTVWEYSTNNFEKYYADFNRFYSIFLLHQQCARFVDEFTDADAVRRPLETIAGAIDDTTRWPEIITFEEMNLRGPGVLERMLLRPARKSDGPQSGKK